MNDKYDNAYILNCVMKLQEMEKKLYSVYDKKGCKILANKKKN